MRIEVCTVTPYRPEPMSTYMVVHAVEVQFSTVAFGNVILLRISRWIISFLTGMFTPFVVHTIDVVKKSRWSSDNMLNGTMTVF